MTISSVTVEKTDEVLEMRDNIEPWTATTSNTYWKALTRGRTNHFVTYLHSSWLESIRRWPGISGSSIRRRSKASPVNYFRFCNSTSGPTFDPRLRCLIRPSDSGLPT